MNPRRCSRWWVAGFAGGVLGLGASCTAPPASPPPVFTPAPTEQTVAADPVEERADQLRARARSVEPAITPLLRRIATQQGGRLIKLGYRLKSRASIVRKIRSKLAGDPGRTVDAVVIVDALRYTLVLSDEPAGHYVAAIREALEALEAVGHEVVELKNYWPTGDNYSGVHAVLRMADGLLWELQFHTPASAACAERTRAWYEELRRLETPRERKRQLFQQMTEEWDAVPLPQGILEPRSLHPAEVILERPAP